MKLGIKSAATLRYRTGYLRNGRRFLLTPWRANLILDSGLNKVSGITWANAFTYASWGNQVSPAPVRRDSSPVTFTVTGTNCIASGSFFVAQDVGRLIKFNDAGGQEFYITNFTSSVNVDISAVPSPAIAVETATIWYVNQTALQSPVSAGNVYGGIGGDNDTTYAGSTATLKRTIIGTALVSGTTLTEIGFNDNGSNVNIFDRDIIPGGIALLTGDQPLVVVELAITVDPTTPLSQGNVGTGLDTSGDLQLTFFAMDIIAANGTTTNIWSCTQLEPAGGFRMSAWMDNDTLPAFTFTGRWVPNSSPNPSSFGASAFVPGVWSRDWTSNFSISVANGTIYGINSNDNTAVAAFAQKFTTPFVKTSLQTLTWTVNKSWGRTLLN